MLSPEVLCAQCGANAQDGNCSPMYDDSNDGGPLCADCGEARYESELSPEPTGPQEGDYVLDEQPTHSYLRDADTGRIVHDMPHANGESARPILRVMLRNSGYWPNVWIISDHGNAHLVSDWT